MKFLAAILALMLLGQAEQPDTRATYEALAERAGWNVVFPRSFKQQPLPSSFNADKLTIPQALDELSDLTKTFWTRWDDKTILAVDDTSENRRNYARQFVQPLDIGKKDPAAVVSSLRNRNVQNIVSTGTGNSILLRDTEEGIRLAEFILKNPFGSPARLDLNGSYLTANGNDFKTPKRQRDQLKVKTLSPVTLDVDESYDLTFQNLARTAGVNILFVRNPRLAKIQFKVKDVDFFDALDLLCVVSSTFWQPINENTILVFEDNPQNRRDFQVHTAETIYLPAGTSATRLNEILNTVRTMGSLRGIFPSPSVNAILLHDTAARLAFAEGLISQITGETSLRTRAASDLKAAFGENGFHYYTAAFDRARLQTKTSTPISFKTEGSSREAYEKLAALAGFQVVWGNARPLDVRLAIENIDAIEALDLLALQSVTFWQYLDPKTILVLDDNQQSRRDFQTHLVKTIYLPKSTSTVRLNEMMNALRNAFSLRGVFQSEDAKAIVIHDTPARVALAENVLEHLNTESTPIRSVVLPAPRFAENATYGLAAAAKSELDVKATGPISIKLNQDSRETFEALADLAGLKISFAPNFQLRPAAPFQLEGVDVLDALDYLSLTTGSAWKVVDRQTILVFSNNAQAHRDLDTQLTKTFLLGDNPTQNAVYGLANILRTALSMRQIQTGIDGITIQDTPQRMALAEKLIESLRQTP
jgi:hypothetical protein